MTNPNRLVSNLIKPGETLEEALGGKLRIIQKKKGYRYSVDAFLLAHFVRLHKHDDVLDLGSGSGVVGLILAARCPQVTVLGLEIQEDLAEMSRRSAALSGLSERIEVIRADVRSIKEIIPTSKFDAAVMNPPYRRLHSGRINPNSQKALARHEIHGTVADFLKTAAYALKKSGRIFVIYPAARTVQLIARMRAERLEPKRLRIVHSHWNDEAELVMVEGLKEGREEIHILPPLYVYNEEGAYTDEAAAIFADLSLPAFP